MPKTNTTFTKTCSYLIISFVLFSLQRTFLPFALSTQFWSWDQINLLVLKVGLHIFLSGYILSSFFFNSFFFFSPELNFTAFHKFCVNYCSWKLCQSSFANRLLPEKLMEKKIRIHEECYLNNYILNTYFRFVL